jgi:NAD-dependent deacetylase
MSTSAGIADFRGPQGLYRKAGIDDPELIFDIDTFHRSPEVFYSFHCAFLRLLETVQPTCAHRFFAALEDQGKLEAIITQNIDSLHQRAGSRKVLEIHGGVWDTSCVDCNRHYEFEQAKAKTFAEGVPRCDECEGLLKPHVVFFGEAVRHLRRCQELASGADLFFVAGSSLVVTPAAMLPGFCRGRIVVVNMGELSHSFLPRERIDLYAEENIDAFFSAVSEQLGIH